MNLCHACLSLLVVMIGFSGNGESGVGGLEEHHPQDHIADSTDQIAQPSVGRSVRFQATSDLHLTDVQGEEVLIHLRTNLLSTPEIRGLVVAGDIGWEWHDMWDQYESLIFLVANRVYDGWGNHDYDGLMVKSDIWLGLLGRDRDNVVNSSSFGHYSWNWEGVHFVQCNLFPLDGVDTNNHDAQFGLSFLIDDLASHVGDTGMPVVLIHHYHLSGDGINSGHKNALAAAIAPYNVIAHIMGHLHWGQYEFLSGIPNCTGRWWSTENGVPTYVAGPGTDYETQSFCNYGGRYYIDVELNEADATRSCSEMVVNKYRLLNLQPQLVDSQRTEFLNDVHPPVTTATQSGIQGNSPWFLSPVAVTMTADDPAGSWGCQGSVNRTEYKLDSGIWLPYYSPVSVSGDGVHLVYYKSRDNSYNWEDARDQKVYVDENPPSNPSSANPACLATSGIWQSTCREPSFSWQEPNDGNGSGVGRYYYYWGADPAGESGSWTTGNSFQPPIIPDQLTTLYLRMSTEDIAGNAAGWSTLFTFMYHPECAALSCGPISIDADPVCTGTSQQLTASYSGGEETIAVEWDLDGNGGYGDCLTNPCSVALPVGISTVAARVNDGCVFGFQSCNQATTAEVEALPSPPSAPIVVDLGDCSQPGARVSWAPVPGAVEYDLQVDSTVYPGVTSPFVHIPGDTASHSYAVRGRNPSCGSGDWSPTTSAIPSALLCDGFETGDMVSWSASVP